ncbi:MAG TPA: DUF1080 domain-containing protein [Methylomirabilota bacterium]|nr:DUF1080 domain-containing protein [Methylomirabilota bacterium]
MKTHPIRFLPVVFAGWLAFTSAAVGGDADKGFQDLFNGKDLTGWEGNPDLWSVEDGAITGRTTAANALRSNTFLVWTNGTTTDFELRLSYKLVNGNSGIQYRSRLLDPEKFIVGGYQADFEAGTTYSGILYEERGRGILARRGQVTQVKPDPADPDKHVVEVIGSVGETGELQANIRGEDWNDYTIIANGNQLTHLINGRVTALVIDEHPGRAASTGLLALQLHTGPPMTLQVKNIRLRPLN